MLKKIDNVINNVALINTLVSHVMNRLLPHANADACTVINFTCGPCAYQLDKCGGAGSLAKGCSYTLVCGGGSFFQRTDVCCVTV